MKNRAYFNLQVVTSLFDCFFNLIIKFMINDSLALALCCFMNLRLSIQSGKTFVTKTTKQKQNCKLNAFSEYCKFAHSPLNIKSTLLPSWRDVCKFDCNQSTLGSRSLLFDFIAGSNFTNIIYVVLALVYFPCFFWPTV